MCLLLTGKRSAEPVGWGHDPAANNGTVHGAHIFAHRPGMLQFLQHALFLSVNIRLVRSAQYVIHTDIVKIRQDQKRFGRGDPVPGLIFGQKRLLNTCLHLHGYLRKIPVLAQLSQVVFHLYHLMTLCHINALPL